MALTREEIRVLPDARLLQKICEEASEVIKAVCKHQQYGPRPFAGGVQYNNVGDTNTEANELNALLLEYRLRYGVDGHDFGVHRDAMTMKGVDK